MATGSYDSEYEGGFVRQLEYGPNQKVILDASQQFIVINWTARVDARDFFGVLEKFAFPADNTDATIQIGIEAALDTNVGNLRDRFWDQDFSSECNFLRVDLSETRSVAWERIHSAETAVAGFGDDVEEIFGEVNNNHGLLFMMLEHTAASGIHPHKVSPSIEELAVKVRPNLEAVRPLAPRDLETNSIGQWGMRA